MARNPVGHQRQGEPSRWQQVEIDRPSRMRAELLIEAVLERQHFGARVRISGIELAPCCGALVCPQEDVGRVPDDAIARHQGRRAALAACTAYGKHVKAGRMSLFPVRDSRVFEPPAHLLAVVAEGDRQESGKAHIRVMHNGRLRQGFRSSEAGVLGFRRDGSNAG